MKHVIKVIWCSYIVFYCLLNLQIFANYGFVDLELCKIRPVALEGESLKSQDVKMPAIFVETENKKINNHVNRIKTYLNKLPSYLLQDCKAIHFVGHDQLIKTYMIGEKEGDVSNKDKEEIIGYALERNMHAHVQYQSNLDKSALVHELWHIYDFNHGNSDSKEFQELYLCGGDSITEYGKISPGEFFAEAGWWYTVYPEKLKESNMDVYSYFKNLDNKEECL